MTVPAAQDLGPSPDTHAHFEKNARILKQSLTFLAFVLPLILPGVENVKK